jgi:hypothetical protein
MTQTRYGYRTEAMNARNDMRRWLLASLLLGATGFVASCGGDAPPTVTTTTERTTTTTTAPADMAPPPGSTTTTTTNTQAVTPP